ncbi:polysaccharide deacetylase family protein [Agaribacter flavus]|uniref:Polysaccharide deacetylase family protein n=1 Tax=Agaribacter flavus TaxID=1902781 RepID=A0ABV7FUS8_9ALTE
MRVYQAMMLITLLLMSFVSDSARKEESVQTSLQHASFTILQYHHISDSTPAITSTPPAIFAEHLQYISEHHTVISLEEALDAVLNRKSLPSNAVVISFDDGYLSIFENAHPLLAKYAMPYTVFINPDELAHSYLQLNWQQIKSMMPLATFANHTLDHIHLAERIANESEQDWLNRVLANIQNAEKKIELQLGYSKKWLAYPYGEYNTVLKNALLDLDYIGFAQHSGAVAEYSDFGALPRFPAAGIYANLNTLKLKMHTLPMPIETSSIQDPVKQAGSKLAEYTLTTTPLDVNVGILSAADMHYQHFACYFNGEALPVTTNKVNKAMEITVNFTHEFSPGRTRVNCTAPSLTQKGRFYWYSQAFFVPKENGEYLE